MRITPVGIAMKINQLIDSVVEVGRVTHDTPIAHAGAAVVATVVSAGLEGLTVAEAAPHAIDAAARFGFKTLFAHAEIDGTGVETHESVPTAFAIAQLHSTDAWRACCTAAALGGDADTIAALAGAMVGACTGFEALPPAAVRRVRGVNGIDFETVARALLSLRER
jgi:ADP-ribosylglycohydrolase